jgi:cytidylate kinase
MGLRAELLESIDERCRSWLLETVESFAARPQLSEGGYMRHLVETILSLGAHGQCVIVGRGAVQILPGETTLRVRLVGLLEDRSAAAARRQDLPWQEAAAWVKETDRQRVRFVKEHFQNDPTDPGSTT